MTPADDLELPEERVCTCHPDDNPPVPCPKKFAYSECMRAALREAERKRAEAERDAEKEWIRLGDVLTLGPDTMPSEIPELARREIISSRRQLAAVLDACEEWSGYVVEDTAPRTLLDHINRAIDAARKEAL